MDIQAPWVGKCKEEYYGGTREMVGYCECCGKELYEDEYYEVDGFKYCEDCCTVED